jgi:hypothetical protein
MLPNNHASRECKNVLSNYLDLKRHVSMKVAHSAALTISKAAKVTRALNHDYLITMGIPHCCNMLILECSS